MSLFISFEGGEGGGKTTQINRLAESLTALGHKVITTREPGGTEEGDKIRDFIVQREGGDWSPMAEALLLMAARVMHVDRVVKPALDEGKIVITDRFSDSTVAYQGYGRGMDLKEIDKLSQAVIGDLKPDITFILDIAPKEGLERSERRLASEQLGVDQTEDRFERLEIEFHDKIRQGFLAIAESDPDRCHVIDATQSIDDIAEQIAQIATERLQKEAA